MKLYLVRKKYICRFDRLLRARHCRVKLIVGYNLNCCEWSFSSLRFKLSISSRYHGIIDIVRLMCLKTWRIRRGATSAKVTDLRVIHSTVTPLPVGITVPIFRLDYDREEKEINLDAILRTSSPCCRIEHIYFA